MTFTEVSTALEPAKKPDEKGIHHGHRERMRKQFLEHGLDSFSDVAVLEFLLFYAVPRQDTNALAHRLLILFDSLAGVFSASIEDLMRVGKLSENTATLIKLVPEAARRQQINRVNMDNILNTTRKCGDFLMPYFFGATDEMVYLLSLDAKCKVLSCTKLFTGTINSANLSTRSVVECALRTKATSVVLAHNHTSGIAVPSQEDIRTTETVAHALELMGILLADHIIVADDDYVSMLDSNLIHHPSQSLL